MTSAAFQKAATRRVNYFTRCVRPVCGASAATKPSAEIKTPVIPVGILLHGGTIIDRHQALDTFKAD